MPDQTFPQPFDWTALDAIMKPIHAGGDASIIIFFTEREWPAEAGEAVVRALRERWWHWNGLVVNLRPGEDVQALDQERAQALYEALHARFGPAAASEGGPAEV